MEQDTGGIEVSCADCGATFTVVVAKGLELSDLCEVECPGCGRIEFFAVAWLCPSET